MAEEKIIKRIQYLESEIAAGSKHDGYVMEGLKKELKDLNEKINKTQKGKWPEWVNRF
tara:strand:- start:231 stop:404 length:174 start_codon:yes stop_codon:yes gene_type:complete